MIEVVSTFTRPNADVDFFYQVHGDHPLVQKILNEFNQSIGSNRVYLKSLDRYKMEIAMKFDSQEQFWQFAGNNKELFEQRQSMIEDWCARTGHEYSWKIL
jgi:hypothetical protein